MTGFSPNSGRRLAASCHCYTHWHKAELFPASFSRASRSCFCQCRSLHVWKPLVSESLPWCLEGVTMLVQLLCLASWYSGFSLAQYLALSLAHCVCPLCFKHQVSYHLSVCRDLSHDLTTWVFFLSFFFSIVVLLLGCFQWLLGYF